MSCKDISGGTGESPFYAERVWDFSQQTAPKYIPVHCLPVVFREIGCVGIWVGFGVIFFCVVREVRVVVV